MARHPAGRLAASRLRGRAPRPERGQELNRQLTVTAADGRREASTTGNLIHTSSDDRPVIGRILTVLGCLTMIAGVFLPWTNSSLACAATRANKVVLPEPAGATTRSRAGPRSLINGTPSVPGRAHRPRDGGASRPEGSVCSPCSRDYASWGPTGSDRKIGFRVRG